MPADDNGVRMYQVCGKKLGETCELHYVIDVLEKFYESYGKRALMAMENKGIDWKAISHAFRAAYETKQLLTENIITFPLKNAKFVRDIKEGKYHYQDVNPQLEKLIDEVEELKSASESIKPGVLTLEQKDAVKNYFAKASDLLQKMN